MQTGSLTPLPAHAVAHLSGVDTLASGEWRELIDGFGLCSPGGWRPPARNAKASSEEWDHAVEIRGLLQRAVHATIPDVRNGLTFQRGADRGRSISDCKDLTGPGAGDVPAHTAFHAAYAVTVTEVAQ